MKLELYSRTCRKEGGGGELVNGVSRWLIVPDGYYTGYYNRWKSYFWLADEFVPNWAELMEP